MKRSRNIARWMGILYLFGTAAGIISRVLTAPALNIADTLGFVAANEVRIVVASLMVMTMGMALAFIPVVAYPVLKERSEILALGYVVFRGALEGATYLAIAVSWLLLLPLGRLTRDGGLDVAGVQAMAGTLLEASQQGAVLMVVFSLGGFLLYGLLYQTRLVPRWLSMWGLIAILMNLVAGLLIMFELFSAVSGASTILQAPIFLQEITLAVWLIVQGFNVAEVTP